MRDLQHWIIPEKVQFLLKGIPELDFKNSFYGYRFSSDEYVRADYRSKPCEQQPENSNDNKNENAS